MYPGHHARTSPDKAAAIDARSGEVLSYAELDARSNRLAQLLWAEGLRRGDHLAVFLENHLRYFEVAWAALRSGLYLTTVNRYLTAPEAGYIVDDCGAQVLVSSRAVHEAASAIPARAPGVPAGKQQVELVPTARAHLRRPEPSRHRIELQPLQTSMAVGPGGRERALHPHEGIVRRNASVVADPRHDRAEPEPERPTAQQQHADREVADAEPRKDLRGDRGRTPKQEAGGEHHARDQQQGAGRIP